MATVCAVDAKAPAIELISGVGHALRLLRIPVASDCEIREKWTAARLDDVRPGTVVRVRCRIVPAQDGATSRVAVSIECLSFEGAGAAR